jgi:uncharacterized membrane protein required for colicin V production
MHWLDVVFMFILAFCALLGLIRGFISEALGAIALGIAVSVSLVVVDAGFPAVRDSELVRGSVPPGASFDNYLKVAIYLIGFGVAAYVPRALANTFGNSINVLGIGATSRLFGAIVGLLKGAGYIVAAYLLVELVVTPSDWPSQWRQARSPSWIYETVRFSADLLPDNMRPDIKPPPPQQ